MTKKKPPGPPKHLELARLEKYADRLPALEVCIGRLIVQGIPQREIAQRLGVQQPSISFRLKALKRRIRQFDELPNIYASNFVRDFCTVLDERSIVVLTEWWQCRTQNDIARRHGMLQRDVSELIRKSVDSLEARTAGLSRSRLLIYVSAFRAFQAQHRNQNGSPVGYTFKHPNMKWPQL